MDKKTLTESVIQKAKRIRNPLCKRLYTIKEAAEYLGRAEWGVRDLIWKKEIPVVRGRGSRKIFLDISDLEAYVNRNKYVYH